jgi:hypothetical protein
MSARAICISHETGAGGPDVGRLVSGRLGFQYVDEEIIAGAAQRGGVSPELVADVESRKSFARRIVEQLFWAGTMAATPSAVPSDFNSEPYQKLIVEVIRETAERGDVVIVAHAASMALAGRAGVLRVLVAAPPEVRARRLAESTGVDEESAARRTKEEDVQRASYFKRFYQVGRELPTHYDLVINTEALEADDVAALIVQAAAFEGTERGRGQPADARG